MAMVGGEYGHTMLAGMNGYMDRWMAYRDDSGSKEGRKEGRKEGIWNPTTYIIQTTYRIAVCVTVGACRMGGGGLLHQGEEMMMKELMASSSSYPPHSPLMSIHSFWVIQIKADPLAGLYAGNMLPGSV
eukprot:CAMPEP_0170113526 /NCGR_PEP_ID=MMETSP0020_2-20130122/9963_1 /TAXON_ID=98059 /ORGANISM="Dinobryon sp., Strain UTEXLB2267" /LENGTH=128 /DNA_ID=CAMNT_0010339943 /DNA_START=470 /DNA_END=854 /DNA_ORIENTATION=+